MLKYSGFGDLRLIKINYHALLHVCSAPHFQDGHSGHVGCQSSIYKKGGVQTEHLGTGGKTLVLDVVSDM